MNHFEEHFVYTYEKQPNAWFHYMDGIFMVWNHGADELNKFITHLNSACESITFSSEITRITLSFLDVTVPKVNDHLVTDLYVKPTDQNTCHMTRHILSTVCVASHMVSSSGSEGSVAT